MSQRVSLTKATELSCGRAVSNGSDLPINELLTVTVISSNRFRGTQKSARIVLMPSVWSLLPTMMYALWTGTW